MRPFLFIPIAMFYSLIPTLGLATEYTVGEKSCEDFEYAENWYHNYLKEGGYAHIEGKYATELYGICLVLKGIVTQDDATKRQGLALFDWLTDQHSGINDVSAMFFLAEYHESGGRFNGNIEVKNIDIALWGYSRILSFTQINIDEDYPWGGYSEAEREEQAQIEIVSHAKIPLLYGYRVFYYYLEWITNRAYLEWSTNRAYLEWITNELYQMISSSYACIDLPYKYYYERDIYNYYQQGCRIFNILGKDLWPLETKRQEALIDKTCSKDVLTCGKYMDVYKQINSIIEDTISELKAIPKL